MIIHGAVCVIRVAGCNLPDNKSIFVALTDIYGIGVFRSRVICARVNIDLHKKVFLLNDDELRKIREVVSTFEVEGDLRRNIFLKIKRLKDIKCYRGVRHRLGLPVRGQRTRTNARTRKKFKIM